MVETERASAFRVSLETYERAPQIMNLLALAAEARGYSGRHDRDAGRMVFTGRDSELQARIAELLERGHRHQHTAVVLRLTYFRDPPNAGNLRGHRENNLGAGEWMRPTNSGTGNAKV